MEEAVDAVADRAADNQAERQGRQKRPRPRHPDPEHDHGDRLHRHQPDLGDLAVGLEPAEADPDIPGQHQVEKRRDPDRAAVSDVEHVEQPELRGLIDRQRGDRGHGSGAEVRRHTVTPSAFHSRNACASRGETSGYSGSSPTSGRIFHDRAHLVPTAFSTTTATPCTSPSVKALAGAVSLVTIAFEVMQTSARSTSNSVLKMFLSET